MTITVPRRGRAAIKFLMAQGIISAGQTVVVAHPEKRDGKRNYNHVTPHDWCFTGMFMYDGGVSVNDEVYYSLTRACMVMKGPTQINGWEWLAVVTEYGLVMLDELRDA